MRPLNEFFIGTGAGADADTIGAIVNAFGIIKRCIDSLTAKYLKTKFGYSSYDEMSTYFITSVQRI